MYAVREGHIEVVQLLLEYDSLDVLATNAVSTHAHVCYFDIRISIDWYIDYLLVLNAFSI